MVLPPPIELNDEKREEQVKYNFFTFYQNVYFNKEDNDIYLQQNENLSNYFKNLPLILEDKSVDIAGLVENINYLNQVIDKNVNEAGEVQKTTKQPPLDLTVKALSSGFKIYQYNTFKKAIKDPSPVIINLLKKERNLFKVNADSVANLKLNLKYYSEYKVIEDSLVNQYRAKMELRNRGIKPKREYKLKELENFNEFFNQSYTYIDLQNFTLPNEYEPKVKSAAYNEACVISKNEQEKTYKDFLKDNENNKINTADYTYKLMYPSKPLPTSDGFFDIEKQFFKSGDQLVCQLINIVGLLNENKLNDIDLNKLDLKMNEYEKLLKFVSSLYIPKNEDK
ncbi:hypothetical protein [Acinetobacter oleivorans]